MLSIPKSHRMIPASYRLLLLVIILLGALSLSLSRLHPAQAKGMAENSLNNEMFSPLVLAPLLPRSSAPLLFSLAITATKTYTLATDTDGDQADPAMCSPTPSSSPTTA